MIYSGVTKKLIAKLNELKLLTKVEYSIAVRTLVEWILRSIDSQILEGL